MKCFALYLATDAVNNREDNLTLDINKLKHQHNVTLLQMEGKLKDHADQLELLKQQTGKRNNSFSPKTRI